MRNKSSEHRTRDVAKELLSMRKWNLSAVSKGGVLLEEGEYKNYKNLYDIFKGKSKIGSGDGYPDFMLVESPISLKPLMIIETKADTEKQNEAVRDAIHYGNACLEAGHDVLCVGISGNDRNGCRVEVLKCIKGKWEKLTFNKRPIDWIPSLENTKVILGNDNIEVEAERPSDSKLSYGANRLNEIFRECKIKDEYRPVYAAAFMLALWFDDIQVSSKVILSQVNANIKQALIRAGKINLVNSLKVDEGNEILAEKAWEVVDILKKLNITSFIHEHDYLGQLYETFFRYTGSNTIGQYFTPRHIIGFMCELLEITDTDTVFDPACGTGGFLIGALNSVIKKNNIPYDESIRILKNNIYGMEVEPTTACLCVVNMILRGDGNSGIIKDNCLINTGYPMVDENGNENPRFRGHGGVDFVLMNPPFPHKKTDNPTTDFIDRGLKSLKKKGILASIIPYSLLVKTKEWHRNILRENTLVSVITLPQELFNPYASYNTAIIILKKGVPHEGKKVFFARISNDGYKLKKKSRIYVGNSQLEQIKEAYFDRMEMPELTINAFVSEKSKEWAPEAYIKDDIHIDKSFAESFEDYMRLHASFYIRYGDKVIGSNSCGSDYIKLPKMIFSNKTQIDLNKYKYGYIPISEYFDVKLGGKQEVEDLENGDLPIVTTSEFMNGVTAWKSSDVVFGPKCITVATDGSTASGFVQEYKFYAFYKVAILTPRFEIPVDAMYFVAFMLKNQKWRYVFARKFGKERIINSKLYLPIKRDGKADFDSMCEIVRMSNAYSVIKYFRDLYDDNNEH